MKRKTKKQRMNAEHGEENADADAFAILAQRCC